MKNNSIFIIILITIFALSLQAVSAQLTITIPKFPKLKKDKPPETKTETTSATENRQTPENKSAPTQDKCSESMWLQRHLEEIAKRQKEVDSFTPERGWFTGSFTYNHLLNAVSLSAREKWLKDSNVLNLKDCANLVAAFDKLAASAAKKLPLYTANPQKYNFHNAAEERMMKAALENAATLKIHKIGLNQASWQISKDNYGLPTSRYKHGMIWARNSPDDHPYCKFYYINIIQDYAGGGAYGASYALFIEDALAGYPAG